ncbi:MAG: hypothetical protein LUF35_10285 [Lachnospiraceae bacterium]|nr:hypothetical protein [Lachnospiraceae bacterium]
MADYFVQIRKNHEYVPSKEEITHVEEVLDLLSAVSGDRRFEIAQNSSEERKMTKMEDWLTKALDKATAKGVGEGMKSGLDKGMAGRLVGCVDSLMKNEGIQRNAPAVFWILP